MSETNFDSMFVAPNSVFKGKEFRPYSMGSDALLSQIIKSVDGGVSTHFYACTFFYVHVAPIQEVTKTAFGGNLEKIIEFCNGYSAKDLDDLIPIVSAHHKSVSDSQVEVESSEGSSSGKVICQVG